MLCNFNNYIFDMILKNLIRRSENIMANIKEVYYENKTIVKI